MKQVFSILFLFLLTASASAQLKINDANAEVRPVSAFQAISISNAFDVIINQGQTQGLAVSASNKEDMQHIKTTVENGVLKISFDDGKKWWGKDRKLRAYISVTTLNQLRASGASDIKIEGTLSVPSLRLNLSGASDLKGKLVIAGELNVDVNGASDISITGSAASVKIEASGASDVKAYEFTTSTCAISASGASGVKITVNKELSASLSGASSVLYKGNAVIKDIKTSGASSISRKS